MGNHQLLSALIRHDARLAANLLTAALTSWTDRLTLIFCILVFAVFLREWATGIPAERTTFVISIIGTLIPFIATKLGLDRLVYHRTDGPIAHLAFDWVHMVLYLIGLIGPAVIVTGFAAKAVAAETWILAASIGTGISTSFVAAAFKYRIVQLPEFAMVARARSVSAVIDTMTVRRLAGLGIALGIALWIARFIDPGQTLFAIILVMAGFTSLVVTRVDPAKTRFRAQFGHKPGALSRQLFWRFLLLILPILLVVFFSQSQTALLVAAAAYVSILAFAWVRLLACLAYPPAVAKRVINMLFIAALMLSLLFPPLGIVAIGAAIGRLYKQASRKTWLVE